MRIVTVAAIHLIAGNIDVGGLESLLLVIMAIGAQALDGFDGQRRLDGIMGFMAQVAIFQIGWGVHKNPRGCSRGFTGLLR